MSCNSHWTCKNGITDKSKLLFLSNGSLAKGQDECVGHRLGAGTALDVSADSEEIISRTDDGLSSFVRTLYDQINVELQARKAHSIYAGLAELQKPVEGSVISCIDLNSALDVIKTYYNASLNKTANTDIDEAYDYSKVSRGNLVKKTDFIDLRDKFNNSVIQDCICYCDCNAYFVCSCYGHCNNY